MQYSCFRWYDNQGILRCPVPGCDYEFPDMKASTREAHWSGGPRWENPLFHDHRIMLAINAQTKCAHCDYTNELSLDDLFQHEVIVHETSDMATIEGYLRLMRTGKVVDHGMNCTQEAHKRLLKNLMKHPERDSLITRGFATPLPVPTFTIQSHLEPLIAQPNIDRGDFAWTVIKWWDFLKHLKPVSGDTERWRITYRELRDAYKRGDI